MTADTHLKAIQDETIRAQMRNRPSLAEKSSACRARYYLVLLIILLVGCGPASPSPQPAPVLTKEPTLMPSALRDTQQAPSWWHPGPGLTWQWQIDDNQIDTSIAADVYDVDLYVDQAIIDELRAKGAKSHTTSLQYQSLS
ncbi:endo alpha-1,4 polygalactosaminidase [Candidatus Parcubacteria bacterium]|nr:endo alpha-1,4 polygalactosaminidase [Candidatus Parcubacteria bacterium]